MNKNKIKLEKKLCQTRPDNLFVKVEGQTLRLESRLAARVIMLLRTEAKGKAKLSKK